MKKELTDLELDLIKYVKARGGKSVKMSPADVNQNCNFYQRTKKLEELGYLSIQRVEGKASRFSLKNHVSLKSEESDVYERIMRVITIMSDISEDKKHTILQLLS